jgi:hypothetical protein
MRRQAWPFFWSKNYKNSHTFTAGTGFSDSQCMSEAGNFSRRNVNGQAEKAAGHRLFLFK